MSGTWELFDLNLPTPKKKKNTPHIRKIKGRPLHSMTLLLIGCMEILFLRLATTIFGLD
jgi:hypothetical protein